MLTKKVHSQIAILYRFRWHRNNKIDSTVNTQPFSFATPSQQSTVNSQQS